MRKLFGGHEVLKRASFQIDPGQKVGLVGRNGGGKSTILRLIEGVEPVDTGSITLARGARMGHVPQRPKFGAGVTVRDYVEGGLSEATQTAKELEAAGEAMGTAEGDELERLMKEHDRLTEKLEKLGGWDTGRLVETVLSGIGLAESLWDREADTLSGGEKSRTALCRELVAGHDLLLLDEPTNHLDLEGIEWLEAYLKELRGAVLIVSHDRRLLNTSVDAILELEFGELRKYPGNYDRYVELREERFKSELRAWEIQQDQIRREESFIKKHMGSQRTAEAKGRQKKLRNVERLERPHNDVRKPSIAAPPASRGGELVLETNDLSGGYPNNVLFEGVDLRIGRAQRIGIVGRNGTGKSTLLKILAERMQPLDGKVAFGHKAVCAYYDQETSDIRDDGTPYSEIRRERMQWTDLEVRSHLALFLFRGDEVERPVSALSGGERARLALARLVLSEPSWMAFDEPTNHLDLAGRTALEEMLGSFPGALLCISHDRAFLDGLCTHIFELGEGTVTVFEGNYSQWRQAKTEALDAAQERERERVAARKKQEADQRRKQEAAANSGKRGGAKGGKKPNKQGSQSNRKKGGSGGGNKVRNPYRFEKLEKRIMALEEELSKLQASMTEPEVYTDANKLKDAQIRSSEVERELEEANTEWENWDT